jgi:hypothetical protein
VNISFMVCFPWCSSSASSHTSLQLNDSLYCYSTLSHTHIQRQDILHPNISKVYQSCRTPTTIPNPDPTIQQSATHHQATKMPAVAKSYLPSFAAFLGKLPHPLILSPSHPTNTPTLAFGITYTTVVAAKEGAAIDGARTRWQDQHARARNALSGGMSLADMEKK